VASKVQGRVVLITGGIGLSGRTMARHCLERGAMQVRIVSGGEAKQDAMRGQLADSRQRSYLGNVRDLASQDRTASGFQTAFQAAALKQETSGGPFRIEAVRTNVLGSLHLVEACERVGVPSLACLSIDKAVRLRPRPTRHLPTAGCTGCRVDGVLVSMLQTPSP